MEVSQLAWQTVLKTAKGNSDAGSTPVASALKILASAGIFCYSGFMPAPNRNSNVTSRTTTYRHGTAKPKPYQMIEKSVGKIRGCCTACKREVTISEYGNMHRHRIDRYIHCIGVGRFQ